MNIPKIILIIIIGCIAMISFKSFASYLVTEKIKGTAFVVDGDTLRISETKIRIHGIDAPEMDQTCRYASLKKWDCGHKSREKLIQIIGENQVLCKVSGTDRYKRKIAKCSVKDLDLGMAMVLSGYAESYTKYSTDYEEDETIAKASKSGIWSGFYISAEKHRAYEKHKKTLR